MTTKRRRFSLRDLERRLGPLTLGDFLRSWRLCEELSQRQFARQLGISAANLCDIEKGRKGVSIAKAHEIAIAIGFSPTMLVQLALEEQLNSSGLKFSVQVSQGKRAA